MAQQKKSASKTRGRRKAGAAAHAPVAAKEKTAGADAAILVAFEIHQFKLFQYARLDVHPQTTVLVGLNDVGKSVLFHAIYLYGQIQRAGFRGPLSDERFGSPSGKPTRFVAEWEVRGERWKHSITLDANAPEERLERGDEYWSWNPKELVLDTHGGKFDARELRRYSSLSSIESSQWNLDVDVDESIYEPLAVTRGFATPSAYLFEPSSLGLPTPLDLQQPLRNGHGWAIWLQEIVNRRNEDLGDMEAAVSKLFPFFRRVRVQEGRLYSERQAWELGFADDATRTNSADRLLKILQQASQREVFVEIASSPNAPAEVASETDPAKQGLPGIAAADISSGLLLALAHFSLVYADEAGRLILLEEPENGLNARITLAMMREFLRLVQRRGKQLILTTHNAWWLDLVAPDSIRVMTRDEEGAHIHQPDPARLQALREEMDVYPSEVMSAHGPEGLLLPEPAASEAR